MGGSLLSEELLYKNLTKVEPESVKYLIELLLFIVLFAFLMILIKSFLTFYIKFFFDDLFLICFFLGTIIANGYIFSSFTSSKWLLFS